MRHWLILSFLVLFLTSCKKKHDDGAISMSVEQRDSLLIDYITKEFDLPEYQISDYWRQLKRLRRDTTPTGTVVISYEREFRDYRFKSFLFDSQMKPPFVVEVMNNEDQFISFFSFTDDEFYSGNSTTRMIPIHDSMGRDSVLRQKVNLENNLNQLSKRLNLKNETEIFDLITTLLEVLEIEQTDQESIEKEVRFIFTNMDFSSKDSISNLVEKEQAAFFKKGTGKILLARTAFQAYWKFWIEESEERLIIRAAFFSDIMYVPVYM